MRDARAFWAVAGFEGSNCAAVRDAARAVAIGVAIEGEYGVCYPDVREVL